MRVLVLRCHARWSRVSQAMMMPKSPPKDRGVYVEEIAPPGEHWYKFVLSNGKIGTVHLPDELVDSSVLDEYLRCLLDTIDPPHFRRLKLV
jgi:hypothetical protein